MTAEFHQLLDDLAALPNEKYRAQVDFTIADAREMAKYGEHGIALENLCDNIYEWDIPLSRGNYERLQTLGRHYGLESSRWSFLEEKLEVRS